MSLSNYPPGVSGMEYQIAGGAAGNYTGNCRHYIESARIQPLGQQNRLGLVRDLVQQDKTELALRILAELLTESGEMPIVEEVECGFEGTVDGEFYGGMVAWTCPRCENFNEDEIVDEPDPDRDRF